MVTEAQDNIEINKQYGIIKIVSNFGVNINEINRMTGDKFSDDYIKTMLPIYLDQIKYYCKRTFNNGLPEGVKGVVGMMFLYGSNNTGISSEGLDDYSTSYISPIEQSDSIRRALNPYRKWGARIVY